MKTVKCVCVCVRKWGERREVRQMRVSEKEKERKTDRETDREREMDYNGRCVLYKRESKVCVYVCVLYVNGEKEGK